MGDSPHIHVYGPFRIESELEIPELRELGGSGTRAVRIVRGSVPAELHGGTSLDRFVQLTPSEYLLQIPGTARYHVRNGCEVTVDVAPDAPIANVTTYLLGSVFGALCHQNGLLPLHASAVAAGDAVIAFLGDSGAGKSTLAACLQGRGYTVVADDICLIDPAPPRPHVIPVAGWLKLWNQSLEHLGYAPDPRHRVFSTDDKFRVFLPPGDSAPRQLARVVFLERDMDAAAPTRLDTLPLVDAVAALMDKTYAAYIPVLSGHQAEHFRTCAAVLHQAEPFRLTRPWSLERSDEVLDLLQRELLSAAS